ncbi:MAG: PAS domain S-box protein [Acidobacteria bacterium]|nr:PAS domain S-box protein [Acidobacteriota bacterium]
MATARSIDLRQTVCLSLIRIGSIWTAVLLALLLGRPHPYVAYGLIWSMGLAGAVAARRRLLGNRRAAEASAAALRESEERFRGLFEDAPVAYHEIDRHGIVQRVNRAECELLGYSRREVLGRPVWDFVSPEARQQSRVAVLRKVSGELPLETFCREFERRDGRPLLLEIHENLIYGARGEVVGLRSTMLDVTARERDRQALARRTQELARSNAELEQFAYVASHDLQEPLRKILAFGDRLGTKCGPALDEQGRDYLERMRNAAGRMQSLINALLTLSRVKTKAQPFTRVDLSRTAAEVLSDLEARTEQLEAQIEVGELPTVVADPLQMAQLLQNLIGNALKFHRPDEPPRVRIHCPPEPGPETAGRRNCRIAVEDNGIGFDEKYLDRIFQVFQRLHGRGEYEGTGVGLAICRNIVERHGGAITARSSPGQGASFIVTLPLEQPTGEHKP